MIELEEAREKNDQHMKSQCETEEVALLDSLGRISGETILQRQRFLIFLVPDGWVCRSCSRNTRCDC